MSGNFCSECGEALEPSDKFCSECGARTRDAEEIISDGLDGEELATVGGVGESNQLDDGATGVEGNPKPPASESNRGQSLTPSKRKALIIATSTLGVAIIALAALWGTGTVRAPWDNVGADRDRLEEPFNRAMGQRAALLKLEARYTNALETIQRRVDRYNEEVASVEAETEDIDQQFADEFDACYRYVDVDCPEPDYPEYPDAPNYGRELKVIRDVASEFNRLGIAQDLRKPSESELEGLLAAFVKAAESLDEEANDNARILNEAQGGDADYRTVNTDMLTSLRRDSAVPALVIMNREALEVINLLDLDVDSFDVPGGKDENPRDSSQAE